MPDHFTVDALDPGGAIEEAHDRVMRHGAVREALRESGHTRAGFLAKAAVGGGAVLALPALAAAAPSKRQDTDILNFALTLEYLEDEFYRQGNAKAGLTGRLKRFAEVAGRHEAAHVKLLKAVLGGAAVAKPTFDFKNAVTSAAKFGPTAIALEDTGVSAYTGQVNRIKQGVVLQTAAQIQAVEARHAAWVRHILGERPAPGALNPKATAAQVLTVVRRTGFITSPRI